MLSQAARFFTLLCIRYWWIREKRKKERERKTGRQGEEYRLGRERLSRGVCGVWQQQIRINKKWVSRVGKQKKLEGTLCPDPIWSTRGRNWDDEETTKTRPRWCVSCSYPFLLLFIPRFGQNNNKENLKRGPNLFKFKFGFFFSVFSLFPRTPRWVRTEEKGKGLPPPFRWCALMADNNTKSFQRVIKEKGAGGSARWWSWMWLQCLWSCNPLAPELSSSL